MAALRKNLDTRYFESHPSDRGLVLDFAQAATDLPSATGAEFVEAFDWRVRSASLSDASAQERRRRDAETQIIAFCDDEPQEDLPDITCNALSVKKPGDLHICLPDVFDFALSRINCAAADALRLFGAERFERTSMLFIVQRTDVEPDTCHRPHISHWHDHLSNGQNMDMVYLFHNVLGTENRFFHHNGEAINAVELVAPDNSLSRIGGEIVHRPQQNEGATLRREWGALILNIKPQAVRRRELPRSMNSVAIERGSTHFDAFKDAASRILDGDKRLHPLPSPQTLIDHAEMCCT